MPVKATLVRLFGATNGAKATLFVAALAVAALELFALHAFGPLQNRVLDFMVRKQAATLVPDPDIVIVDIDDASLAKMEAVAGSWPWPRSVHGEMVEGMRRQKPRAIVFDITFSERDVYRPDSDRLFNAALEGNTNIYFPVLRLPGDDRHGALARDVAGLLGMTAGPHARPDARLALQPPLAVDAPHWRTGVINFSEDEDGIGRRYHLYMDVQGWRIPSLPARVASDLGYQVPPGADMLLAWRGRSKDFIHIPYADLYQDLGREKPLRSQAELAGKIVIVGADASALNDLRATPISSLYPGVQILATAIDNLKNQHLMRVAPPWALPAAVLAMLVLLFWAFLRSFNVLHVGTALTLVTLAALGATWQGISQLWLLPAVEMLLLAWLYYFAGALQAYLAERKTRQRAVTMFSRFVNPEVVQQLVTSGALKRGGESREISVLFSDIRGFTTLSEKRTPQQVVALLNRYFTLQVEVVFRHGGSLDKFIGDCIMAFWGAPLDDPDHAKHAVLAALEMAEVLQRFKKELGEEDADFDVGIGIHSGPAVVGLIGSEQRREYTAIGDTVNLASRIEGLTKGVARILVSEETMKLCGDAFVYTPYGSFEVKGRGQQVNLFGPTKGEST
jgi:adenylate cyclase